MLLGCIGDDFTGSSDLANTLAKQGKVFALKFSGKRFDCGSVSGFVEATNYFYSKSKE